MAARQRKAGSCWSHLPPELAGLVLGRFPSFSDRVRFSSVCRDWRHAARQQAPVLPPPFPWTITFSAGTIQTIPDGQVHHLCSGWLALSLCSSESWLLMTGRESDDESKMRNYLKNPLSGATLTLPNMGDRQRPGGGLYRTVTKFIVCPDNLVVATIRSDPLLAFCQPGMSSWSMSSLAADTAGDHPEDIALHDGSVYAITGRGDLFALRISENHGHGVLSSCGKLVIKGADTYREGVRRFLVVSSRGDTLLMVKWNHGHHGSHEDDVSMFEVFEADLQMSRWSTLSGLNDQVLFVSRRCSKAVPVSPNQYGYLCGGGIYFVDHAISGRQKCCRGPTCCGMYDMRNNKYHAIVSDAFHANDIAATSWFFPHK